MTPIVLKCSVCEYTWVERIDLPMDVRAFVDRIDAWSKSCPDCGRRFKKGEGGILILTGEAAEKAIKQSGSNK